MNMKLSGYRLWVGYALISFFLNLTALLASRVVVSGTINLQNIIGFSILSLIISVLILLGYFGFTYFIKSLVVTNIIAVIYLFYAVLNNVSDGWTDLISIFSFLTILLIGFVCGILFEITMRILRKFKLIR